MKSTKTAFLAGVMFLGSTVTPHSAHAQNPIASTYSGNDLLRDCSDRDTASLFSFCLGYINGIRDGAVFASVSSGTKQFFEISEKVELGQLRDVVVKYLKEHPEERHLHATVLVYKALREAFPPTK